MANKKKDFTDLVIQHEGLLPNQTPFRITSPEMTKWKTIHGYKTSDMPKPKGRENFLFVENQADVKPAVSKQFQNYYNKPGNYGFKKEPTVAEAVKKFDQTGAPAKIKFLEANGINTKLPLRTLFEEAEVENEILRQTPLK